MRNSIIILAHNIKLDKDYRNVLSYSEGQILDLVRSHAIVEGSDFSFLRPGVNSIRVPWGYGTCLQATYIAFQNPNYSNKWFFAFVDSVDYISDSVTQINYTVDEWSTWYDYWQGKYCFVVREHVSNDAIGANTIPEDVETGEYVYNNRNYYTGLDDMKYVMLVTEWASSDDKPLATNFGGIFMAGGAYVFSNMGDVVTVLNLYDKKGKSDAVYMLYMIPSSIITTKSGELQYGGQSSPITLTYSVGKTLTVNGYTPTNNKLRCFPYNYMIVSNNNGSSEILHYERFSGDSCNFNIVGVPTVGGSIKLYPTNYDGGSVHMDYALMAGKYPTLSWSQDAYTNWLTQNSVNISLGLASTGLTAVGGIAESFVNPVGGASTIVGAGMSAANAMGSVYQHSLMPNTARGNTNGGDINISDHSNGFNFYNVSIKREYAEVIDRYFNEYGYKINKVKIPNFASRKYWNYVQIGRDEIHAVNDNNNDKTPASSLITINNILRRGVTIWHQHDNIGNYSLSNTIV